MEYEVLKVSSKSVPTSVAGAIANVIQKQGSVELQAVGAGATNQAVKSVAIARTYLSETGMDLICTPEFFNVTIDDEDRSAIKLIVEVRK